MCSCNKARRPPPSAAPAAVGRPAPRTALPSVAVTVAPPPDITIPTVDTSVWGAALWRVLHTASVATKYSKQARLWRELLAALRTGIPCPECSAHYNAWHASHGIRFTITRDGIRKPVLRWVLDLHNDVNARTGSSSGAWTEKQVMDTYRDLEGARAALASLQGVIGDAAWAAATALLNSL